MSHHGSILSAASLVVILATAREVGTGSQTARTGIGNVDPTVPDMGAEESCPWDCEPAPDGDVGITDFLAMLALWGGPGSCDFDGGGVGITDFLDLLTNWGPCPMMLQIQLQIIRSQIELYNVQNPATTYDATTSVIGFWDPLVQGGYLPAEPENHLQNNSTLVGAAPAPGLGWVWAEASAGDTWTLNLYAVDANGGWYDGDGNGYPD